MRVIKCDPQDLTQRDVEAFFAAYDEFKLTIHDQYGAILRAGIKAKWLSDESLTVESVPNMKPREVRKLANEIDDALKAATAIDPK